MAGRIRGTAHDFLYVPQVVAEDYISVSRHFMRHQAMIEVAFSAIQFGLAGRGRLKPVQGASLFGSRRHRPGVAFNQSHLYLHPFKLRDPKGRREGDVWDFYCGVYLRRLFAALTRK